MRRGARRGSRSSRGEVLSGGRGPGIAISSFLKICRFFLLIFVIVGCQNTKRNFDIGCVEKSQIPPIFHY